MLPRVGYVTDVEGNLDYFERYVARSEVLSYERDGVLKLALPDDYFVYGGDVVDQSSGDLRLCEQLVGLKARYPQRVFLLVGNRDLNKLRFTSELAAVEAPSDVPKPHWDPSAPSYTEYLATTKSENGRPSRLKWMLRHTLGCPKTFELRRAEMALITRKEVTDEEVVESCLESVNAGGALRRYLECACVAARLGQTLFVHGAVDRFSAGFVPGMEVKFAIGGKSDAAFPPSRPMYEDIGVDEWVLKLNSLLKEGLADHLARPTFDANKRRGGEVLLALQNRCAVWGRSVVSNCYCDGGNVDSPEAAVNRATLLETSEEDPLVFERYTSDARDPLVANWLRASGVRRVVVGHKPVGDSPAILSALVTGVEIIDADTSYSDTKAPDMRGCAVTALVLVGTLDDNRSIARGTLRDGREYTTDGLPPPKHPDNTGDPLLGTVEDDGWWYKAIIDDGAAYHQSKGHGHTVLYRDKPRVNVKKQRVK